MQWDNEANFTFVVNSGVISSSFLCQNMHRSYLVISQCIVFQGRRYPSFIVSFELMTSGLKYLTQHAPSFPPLPAVPPYLHGSIDDVFTLIVAADYQTGLNRAIYFDQRRQQPHRRCGIIQWGQIPQAEQHRRQGGRIRPIRWIRYDCYE